MILMAILFTGLNNYEFIIHSVFQPNQSVYLHNNMLATAPRAIGY